MWAPDPQRVDWSRSNRYASELEGKVQRERRTLVPELEQRYIVL